jgi:hypothetical protein
VARHAARGGPCWACAAACRCWREALIDTQGIDGNAPAWACCRW